ncbi:MAG: hypothetical protein JWN55_1705 [Frankiales bacterium]|nr:hypothetical protein [Frankiales bacterium]
MTALLGSLLVVVLLAVVALALLVAFTVVPFVAATDMAERRGFSTGRWGGLALLGIALAAVGGYVVHAQGWSLVLWLPVVLLPWSVPALLALMDAAQSHLGGRAGTHEY